jgi:hypothetical protein
VTGTPESLAKACAASKAAARARAQTDRPCKSGQHIIPAGELRCAQCRAPSKAKNNHRRRPDTRGTSRTWRKAGTVPDLSAGACARPGVDPTLFEPNDESHSMAAYERVKLRWRMAREYCTACPVLADCRAYGLENKVPGTWGGIFINTRGQVQRNGPAAPGRPATGGRQGVA